MLCLGKFVYHHDDTYNIERYGDIYSVLNEVKVGKVSEEDAINSFYQKVSTVFLMKAL